MKYILLWYRLKERNMWLGWRDLQCPLKGSSYLQVCCSIHMFFWSLAIVLVIITFILTETEASFTLNLFPDGYSIGKPSEVRFKEKLSWHIRRNSFDEAIYIFTYGLKCVYFFSFHEFSERECSSRCSKVAAPIW